MVNVDTVYQKVLTLANKEQRGYITPQEFNLMADKAQLEIVENYFHTLKTAYHKIKSQTEISDGVEMIMEKLSYLRSVDTTISISAASEAALPNCYKIATVYIDDDDSNTSLEVEVEEVDRRRLLEMLQNPLTNPTTKRPVYIRVSNDNPDDNLIKIKIFPDSSSIGSCTVDFYRKPNRPNWGYVVVNQKALYNFNTSQQFQLHPSEEETLVTKILQLAGVTIEKLELTQVALADQQKTRQEQNS